MSKIRVLVVDDSLFTRKRLIDMLLSSPDIEIIDTAQNGIEAIEKVRTLSPDVVTLDIEMAKMDGITALRHIMKEHPTPILMVSTLTEQGSEVTAQALMEGAVDFIHKPTELANTKLMEIQGELIRKVTAASRARINGFHKHGVSTKTFESHSFEASSAKKIVMIGSSTGGPRALVEVLPRLPKNFPAPIAIVQHMPPGPFIRSIAKRIESESKIQVKEAEDGDRLMPGVALMAPGGCHLLIEKNGIVKLNHGPAVNSVKPSVDVMMSSGATVYGSNVLGVVLTGMGRDGADGMSLIKKHGGKTIAEDESTCTVYGMPKAVADEGNADKVVPISRVAEEIVQMIGDR